MKKTIAAIIVTMGLVGFAKADTNYACEVYSGKINGEGHMLVGGLTSYTHAATGEMRNFETVNVTVHSDNTFSFYDLIHDKTIKSPKLKDLSTKEVIGYGIPDKSIAFAYGEDGNPIFRYMKDGNMYQLMGCTKID